MGVIAILNPLSGAGADPAIAQQRVALVRSIGEQRNIAVDATLTERAGHARELARRAAASGAPLVIAWGGDGTINGVGCALMGTRTPLGVVPAGSGNGLASALGLPWQPHAALAAAFDGMDKTIDAGMLANRPFFNVAGIGFDAHVARLFNERPRGRRGKMPYVTISVREGCRYAAAEYRLTLDGRTTKLPALLITFANGQEFGMGARIAPKAKLDDGLLDAVVVEDRSVVSRFLDVPYLAFAAVHRARGVRITHIKEARIETDGPIEYHVDGEPGVTEGSVDVRIVPGALRVRVPRADVRG